MSLGTSDAIHLAATVGTFLGLLVAIYQLRSIDRSRRRWGTLTACDRYDTNEEIAETVRRLEDACAARLQSGMPAPLPLALSSDVFRLLNFFDSLAIGIEQGFYIEAIARAHLGKILVDWIDDLLKRADIVLPRGMEELTENWSALARLYTCWRSGRIS